MSNMGYCRFENTSNDLSDCAEHIADDGLSATEAQARKTMIRTMIEMLEELGADIDTSGMDPDLL